MSPDDLAVSTVHDALQAAAFKKANDGLGSNVNFRLHPRKKALLQEICNRNNAASAVYLRCCVDALLKDYLGASGFAILEAECNRR